MSLALLMMLSQVAVPPVAVITPARPPVPKGSPGAWATNDDYPADALRAGSEGRVTFSLSVSADGTPTACTIVASSGNSSLDETTCRLVTERARFTPARDSAGAAITGTYMNSVRWVIPQVEAQAFRVSVLATVTTEGRLTDCRMESVAGSRSKLRLGPVPCPPNVRYAPFTDAGGKAVLGQIRLITELQVVEPAPVSRRP